ncbi:MAG: Mur ligase family protein [Parvularculaceae bacterium]
MDADFGVFEIGISRWRNHAAHPPRCAHVAIVTTIAPAHLEFFGTLEAIAEAKSEIFLGVMKGGAVVLPFDIDQYSLLAARAGEAGVSPCHLVRRRRRR